jgi:hypothetical protein
MLRIQTNIKIHVYVPLEPHMFYHKVGREEGRKAGRKEER